MDLSTIRVSNRFVRYRNVLCRRLILRRFSVRLSVI